jgi:hypothetical protein
MPRFFASAAISRGVQWLIGRSEPAGFSQPMAISRQHCWALKRPGLPERGKSANRAATGGGAAGSPGAVSSQRRRQSRTTSVRSANGRATWVLLRPVAQAKTMRPRSANCCGVEGRWTRVSKACCSVGVRLIGGGVGPRGGVIMGAPPQGVPHDDPFSLPWQYSPLTSAHVY